jgi:hypothetical protein
MVKMQVNPSSLCSLHSRVLCPTSFAPLQDTQPIDVVSIPAGTQLNSLPAGSGCSDGSDSKSRKAKLLTAKHGFVCFTVGYEVLQDTFKKICPDLPLTKWPAYCFDGASVTYLVCVWGGGVHPHGVCGGKQSPSGAGLKDQGKLSTCGVVLTVLMCVMCCSLAGMNTAGLSVGSNAHPSAPSESGGHCFCCTSTHSSKPCIFLCWPVLETSSTGRQSLAHMCVHTCCRPWRRLQEWVTSDHPLQSLLRQLRVAQCLKAVSSAALTKSGMSHLDHNISQVFVSRQPAHCMPLVVWRSLYVGLAPHCTILLLLLLLLQGPQPHSPTTTRRRLCGTVRRCCCV